jgi:hypothetical protein
LFRGNASNGPGPGDYFHPFSFEYTTKDGSGNMTQFAIPYNANQNSMYFRGRYEGTWGSWYTMWNSGNLTNLNQLTNGPGYITGINSSAVTTALGYTPYNATNPNGYITSSGNVATVGNLTPAQFFNNMGGIHSTRTSFDASTPSYDFGFRYVQGSTNGPGTGGNQFYSIYLGLGSDYPATGSGSYGMYMAIDRDRTNPYLSIRYNEGNSLTTWRRINAGYADTAGTASNITSYTINQNLGTSNLPTFAGVKGSSYFDAQSGSGFRIRNASDNGNVGGFTRSGLWEGNSNYTPSIWCETGYGFNIYTNGSATIKTTITPNGSLLHGHAAVPSEDAWLGTAVFGRDSYNKVIIGSLNSSTTGAYIGGHNSALTAWGDLNIAGEALIFRYQQTERARFDTSGHFIPGANNAYNLGSSSLRWANIFTNDLHLSNMNKPGGNDVDGTKGDWTIQEGAENLYIINNNNGKKYKITLEETL